MLWKVKFYLLIFENEFKIVFTILNFFWNFFIKKKEEKPFFKTKIMKL